MSAENPTPQELTGFELRMVVERIQFRLDVMNERSLDSVSISKGFATEIVRACQRGAELLENPEPAQVVAAPTGTNENGLLPCPFCGSAVQPRDALWPSEGDSDAVIHAAPTDCPMATFNNGSADKSVYALWNARPTDRSHRLKDRIDTRLNDHLCDMKEGYDDSIVGFNEAWEIVRAIFAEELKL